MRTKEQIRKDIKEIASTKTFDELVEFCVKQQIIIEQMREKDVLTLVNDADMLTWARGFCPGCGQEINKSDSAIRCVHCGQLIEWP